MGEISSSYRNKKDQEIRLKFQGHSVIFAVPIVNALGLRRWCLTYWSRILTSMSYVCIVVVKIACLAGFFDRVLKRKKAHRSYFQA